MSYSYYLLHGLALKAGFLALAGFAPVVERGPLFFWALMPAMFAWTLIPTSLLFLLVERPFSLTPRHARTESRESSSTLHP
jgi:peptidoglycan/LPS O-acetylase OafA/YrhL